MPLIDSPRLTARDRDAWRDLERYDRALATTARARRLAATATATIHDFHATAPCSLSVSWGKDSMVVAHLVAETRLPIPFVFVRVAAGENPDCDAVRDAFLTRYPHVDYREHLDEETAARRFGYQPTDPERPGVSLPKLRIGPYITGLRAEESATRAASIKAWHGITTKNTCRPIAFWTAVDVFAYLAGHDLPVHPAYAMSHGGHLDRRWLRVSSLGGTRGADRGRTEWEYAYYGDILQAAKRTETP